MIRLTFLFIILCACWLILSGQQTPFYLICGLLSSFTAIIACFILGETEGVAPVRFRPLSLLFYGWWLLRQIALATVSVTRQVWTIDLATTPRMEWLDSSQHHPTGLALYGHCLPLSSAGGQPPKRESQPEPRLKSGLNPS